MGEKHNRGQGLKVIYSISLGCGECKKPLEPVEPINKVVKKFYMHHDLPKPASDKLADPVPVATKCGHIFHRGCIKKIISSMASSKIPCPTCAKPVILAHLHVVRFFYPSKRDSLSKRIQRANEENNGLTNQLEEVRKIRVKKQFEEQFLLAKIEDVKSEIKILDSHISRTSLLCADFNQNGVNPEELANILHRTKTSILEISLQNSELLQRLEKLMNIVQKGGYRNEEREELLALKQDCQNKRIVKQEIHPGLEMVANYYANKLSAMERSRMRILVSNSHSRGDVFPGQSKNNSYLHEGKRKKKEKVK